MNSDFYLPRKLSSEEKTYTEADLLAASKCIIVLSEPGGGKTALLNSLAEQLGTSSLSATMFAYIGSNEEKKPLVIDAFDEVAKISASDINKLLAQISRAKPTQVIISSRSSEWDIAATNKVKEFLGLEPLLIRLCEFNDSEQRTIFDHHAPTEDFSKFHVEVSRFDLDVLLSNPQFLKMFSYAYLESKRSFSDKRSIFKLAVEHLAKEYNQNSTPNNSTLSLTQKIDLSSEVFAKLLLSGVEGVSINEAAENPIYPTLLSLINGALSPTSILATRLFKQADSPNQHRPVHKIVAEYCTAEYLTKRIINPSDPLTLHHCLPIIAPNSTVRNELRGLLGWMAALGNKDIQIATIELDPYAVLANGDPSQLEPSSKQLLLSKLKDIEAKDPFFRSSDFGRRFSVAGFFSEDIVGKIKALLMNGSDGHLRNLILELLVGSPVNSLLLKELRDLTLNNEEHKQTRLLASKLLFDIDGHNFKPDFTALVSEASNVSLAIVAKGISALGSEIMELTFLETFFRVCTNLYLPHKNRAERIIGERYFIKRVIDGFNEKTIVHLLNMLTRDLICTCGLKSYECDCRNGISKIVGNMLDRYFEIATPPFDPLQVWGWLENLNFHGNKSKNDSKSVQVLFDNTELRQGILRHVLGSLTDRDTINETKMYKFGSHSHCSLCLFSEDKAFLADLAFESNNHQLWASFITYSHFYFHNNEERGPDKFRQDMRKQAQEKPAFMREWMKLNRAGSQWRQNDRKENIPHKRVMKRHKKKKNRIYAENIKYIQDNRELVEKGHDWPTLFHFAGLVLLGPDNIEIKFGDETLVRHALRNCLDFIEPEIPDLQKLAQLQCESKSLHLEIILFAACIEIMRTLGNLDSVKPSLLTALKTNFNVGYSAVDQAERDALKAEVNRILFPDIESAEQFLRQYLEPQLAHAKCSHPEVCLLQNDPIFSPLKARLSIEWLDSFNELEFSAVDSLFEIAAQHGNREELKRIIHKRCSEFASNWPDPTDDEKRERMRKFWIIRAFYFLHFDAVTPYLHWLESDKNTLLWFEGRSGGMNRSDHRYWPDLSSLKIEAILNAFFVRWPKVHLPSGWGTASPVGETAYRFLTNIIWSIGNDGPDKGLPVLNRLLENQIFTEHHNSFKSIQADLLRKSALIDFKPPTPEQIVDLLDNNAVVTVEGLRQLVLQTLFDYQKDINGGEFNEANGFYRSDKKGNDTRQNEVNSVNIIANRMKLVLLSQNIIITPEHQTKNQNRIDITAAKMIDGKRRLLVIEAKGQWHKDLYSAASTQLYERYSIHPDAEHQGIYLVIWFGSHEKVADKKGHGITSAQELKKNIETKLAPDLKGLIDVFVLDVSRD